jgi:amino acid transporter
MKVGKWTENSGGITAWVIIGLLIAAAALVWAKQGSVTAIHVWPEWNWDTLSLFGAIAYGLSGMELIGMMSSEIRSPERTVIPATWMGTAFVVAFYIAATVSVLVLIPPEKVDILRGLADSGNVAAAVIGWVWMAPLMAGLILVNSVGAWGGYGASVSRMPYAAGVDKLLPEAFGKIHPRWGTPYVSILTFAVVTSGLLVVTQFGDTMKAAYQTILSLMVISGFLPYVYVFLSAWKCQRRISAVFGLAVTALAVVSSVVPTPDVTNVVLFETKILGGTVGIVGLAWLVYRRGTIRNA